ncbi:MAG: PQQ-binding-like beta-propeller repeat protein, partial [Pirellulaceae bacterium]|nr:PQQ-binding-like beta-propeller repeat protein [Pirellulaceae bacterium]
GPLFPYKLIPGCDHRSVIARGVAYGVDDGTVFAYDLKNSQTALTEAEFNGKKIKPAHWRAPLLWKLPTTATGKKAATTALIKAGDRLYAHSGKLLFAVELNPENTASAGAVAWTKQLTATPTSMLAAADRLFVCTDDGAIQCFGAAAVKPRRYASRESDTRSPPDAWTSLATTIRTVSGDDGYAIVAGLDEGRLVAELLLQSRFNVIAIDQDVAKIDALRRRFGADERFLSRFQAVVADPTTIALPPYIANLIVSESVDVLQLDADSNLEKLYRHLRPYGGLLCLPLDEQRGRAVEKLVAAEQLAEAETKVLANLTTIERRGPLPGSAVWTHETADAARSFYSQDELVQAPLAILWYGDGRDHGFFKRKDYGHGLKPQVAGGRLFALQVATNTLKSVDAYTGRLLWSKKLGGSARYASMPNAVYVADNRQCLVLDPATGEVVNTFGVTVGRPDKVPVSASDIRVGEKTIVIAVRFNKENAISKGRWNSEFLVALDRKTGRQLWSRPAQLRYNTAAIAVANGRVFCIDSHSPAEIALMRRRGDAVDKLPSTILALEAGSGRELWKVVRKDPPAKLSSLHFMGVRTQDDWLAYAADKDLLIAGKADATFAFDAKSGEEVWDKPRRGQQPLILGPETFINQTGHTYDVANGDLVSGTALFRRSGCNYAVGGKNLLFLRANCATYVDVATRQEFAIRSVRSGCSNSLVAADGLLNAPCFSVGCVCNYPLQTSFAMFHLPAAGEWHE